MEWPIKTKFGWPFLKLHGHKAEVLSAQGKAQAF